MPKRRTFAGNSGGHRHEKRQHQAGGGGDEADDLPTRDFEDERSSANKWRDIDKHNEMLETYYGHLNLLGKATLVGGGGSKVVGSGGGSEWEEFLAALRRPLPSTFRISPMGHYTQRIRALLSQLSETMSRDNTYPLRDVTTNEVVAYGPPRELGPWNPTAWTTGTDRTTLRRRPELKRLHNMLVRATDTGAVARQELVSMVPPMALIKALELVDGNSQTPYWILDMCAAPGSKTLQLLEMLESDKRGGVLVANDVDTKRAYMLTKRVSTIRSPSIVIATHDGSSFPQVNLDAGGTYHGVLCDVPCSGDGTIRKNPDLWKQYNPRDSVAMHPLQLRIALRGMSLLKQGGVLVYSTCSMNPIEDEAIVCELLRETHGEFELIEFPPHLFPGLVRRHGLSSGWSVPLLFPENHPANTTGKPVLKIFDSMSELDAYVGPNGKGHGIPDVLPSMFPPLDGATMASYHLERTVRFLPHDQDSGGFFVCAFKRLSENVGSSTKPRNAATTTTTTTTDDIPAPPKSRRPNRPNIHPQDVWYDPIPSEAWNAICSDWGIDPQHSICQRLLIRKTGKDEEGSTSNNGDVQMPQKIAIASADVVRMLDMSAARNGILHVVNAGVVGLQKIGKAEVVNADSIPTSRYRVTQDGITIMRPLLTKRVIQITLANLADACKSVGGAVKSGVASAAIGTSEVTGKPATTTSTTTTGWAPSIQVRDLEPSQAAMVNGLCPGGLVLELTPLDQTRFQQVLGGVLLLSAWWGGKTSITTMVDKLELSELFEQCEVTGLF